MPSHKNINGMFSKYITDLVRTSNQATFNRAYIEAQQRKKNGGNQRSPTSETDEDVDDAFDEEQMDESDNSLKNVINRNIVDNSRMAVTRVFCCGDGEKLTKVMKLHLTRQSPGQAMKVITAERGSVQECDVNQRKKLKIADIADV